MLILRHKGVECHNVAATHFEKAAEHHKEAAKFQGQGEFEKAALHSSTAWCHEQLGVEASNKASNEDEKEKKTKKLSKSKVKLK